MRGKMKKIYFISVILFVFILPSLFGKELLSWKMPIKKFEKKVEIKQKYETEEYTIIFLPKNSYYNNEYDEYLLFGNINWQDKNKSQDKILLRRLQLTNLSFEDCKNIIKENNQIDKDSIDREQYITSVEYDFGKIDFLKSGEEIEELFDEFPNKNSSPITLLLLNHSYNYSYNSADGLREISYGGFFDDYDRENCMGILLNNKSMIIKQDSNVQYFLLSLSENLDHEIIDTFTSFIDEINERKIVNLLKNNKKGPFGTIWGMGKEELQLIVKKNTMTEEVENYLNDITYTDHYSKYVGTSIINFIPEKEVDFVSAYYSIFDEEEGLYKIFTIINSAKTAELKNISQQANINEIKFNDVKNKIIQQYGTPKQKSEKSLMWVSDDDIKIELFLESKIVELYSFYDGKTYEGKLDYTCLVYTDQNKEANIIQRIKKETEKKQKEIENETKKREEEQKSYF